ncbi:MAG: YggT family protein [Bdellovibrio sp.]|nr:YggT family protein [Methylotenera sp.]
MISSAFNFLLTTLASLLTLLFLLRFFMQLLKAPFRNPLGQMVISLTDFVVKPVRKLIPSLGKVDCSTLLLAFLTQLLLQIVLLKLRGLPFSIEGHSAWPSLLGLSLIGVLRTSLDLFFYALLLQVILSWVNPHTPVADVLASLTRPILAPFQRMFPTAGGIDFSPMVAIILIQMINISVVKTLESQLLTIF